MVSCYTKRILYEAEREFVCKSYIRTTILNGSEILCLKRNKIGIAIVGEVCVVQLKIVKFKDLIQMLD